MYRFSAALVCAVVIVAGATGKKTNSEAGHGSEIRRVYPLNLPGYNGPNINLESGYLLVNKTLGRNIFYMFALADNNWQSAPLVVWFQGGPGCSGLFGFFTESGNARIDRLSGNPVYNGLAWTTVANVLYLEQPIGVGFSYSLTKGDALGNNDFRSARDSLRAIEVFLLGHPQLQGNDLWLTGESYGGTYVPMVSSLILTESPLVTQFRGVMIGNPYMNCADWSTVRGSDTDFQLLYWHGMISQANYVGWMSNGCNLNGTSDTCQNILNLAMNQSGVIVQQVDDVSQIQPYPSWDPDNLYQDFCTGNASLNTVDSLPACSPVGDALSNYLSRQDVQLAMGVYQPNGTIQWEGCTPPSATFNYTSSGLSMQPYLQQIINAGKYLLLYSGDVDIATVPFPFTLQCLAKINAETTNPWQPWFVNGHTAGYVETHEGYTFATVKASGHEMPYYTPRAGLELFRRFLLYQDLLEPNARSSSARTASVKINDNSKPASKNGAARRRPFTQRDALDKFVHEQRRAGTAPRRAN